MSDYRNDNDRSYRSGFQRSNDTGFWPWLTAGLAILGTLLGLTIGYNWNTDHQRSAQSSPPVTTGSTHRGD
jgi:hypothetical protein